MLCMAHTLIQIQSYLFTISQPKVSFQFLIFKESSYMVFTSTYIIFIQSHILRLRMGSTTFQPIKKKQLSLLMHCMYGAWKMSACWFSFEALI